MDRRAKRGEPERDEPGLFDSALPAPAGTPQAESRSEARAEAPPAPPARGEPAPPPLFTVAQLSGVIQGRLAELGRVRVEGEVSQKKRAAAGHVYFDLKDAGAKLACKIWQSQVPRVLRFDLAEGAQVIAWGKLDVYAPQGGYSLIVDKLEPVGLGALLAQLEARKAELKAKGWFERKRALPAFPPTIGLVTSRDGAALRDFLKTRSLRWPGYPVRFVHTAVQGPGAAQSIAAAVRALDESGVDAIALVRGGGSLEDLWAFNELAVAEAIWNSRVPVVTGVGHETDVTLADLVADRRAHTPTDAAQTLIPDRGELCARIARLGNYLSEAFEHHWRERVELLERLRTRPVLRDANWILDERTRALAAQHARLDAALASQLERRAGALSRSHARLARRTPAAELARRAQRLVAARVKLGGAVERTLEQRANALAVKARSLEAVSPLAVLGRGYAIVRAAEGGAALSDVRALAPGQSVDARLARGSFRARIESVQPPVEDA
ncbi:MAG: exodeoxyribonuclease VII large subunit [Planctomycetes bacterium]|nr:exodeoxyribonuclease VII large subunit [Planctomycetota bacterium]